MDDDDDYDCGDYDSGPFCQHWGDPGSCEVKCASCGHSCGRHWDYDCQVEGCGCKGFEEPEE